MLAHSADFLMRLVEPETGDSSRPTFHARKTTKIPFLGLSLLPNSTEKLAMQASAE